MSAPAKTKRRRPSQKPGFTVRRQSKAMARSMAIFDEDAAWIDEHYDELVTQYPRQWIAVFNKRVIASDRDLKALYGKVADHSFVNVEFMTRDEVIEIL